MNIKHLNWVMSILLISSCNSPKETSINEFNKEDKAEINNWQEFYSHSIDIEVNTLLTGYISGERKNILNKKNDNIDKFAGNNKQIPVKSFWVKHPKYGDIIIDTGFDNSFQKSSDGNLNFFARLVSNMNKYKNFQPSDESINAHISKEKIRPQKIFLTHLHHDHTSGLSAFAADVEILFDKNENNILSKLIVSNHFNDKKNIKHLDFSKSFSLPPFDKVIDVFGDCSILAISTPGHTKGHVSYLINDKTSPVFIIGDAIMYKEALYLNIEPYAMGGKNIVNAKKCFYQIKDFIIENPNITFIYTHDE